MAEPEEIAAAAQALVFRNPDFQGLKLVVSAGPTREYLDPVRFISNPSSGKMGYAVATEARARGASVTLVSGPVNLPDPPGVDVVKVESAVQMHDAVLAAAADAQIVVMTAAVADYRAAEQKTEKEAKTAGEVSIQLVPNPDILAALGQHKAGRVLVGFAMETHAGVERAALKARRKNADFILLNYPTQAGHGLWRRRQPGDAGAPGRHSRSLAAPEQTRGGRPAARRGARGCGSRPAESCAEPKKSAAGPWPRRSSQRVWLTSSARRRPGPPRPARPTTCC